ncbi:MAG: cell wall hydrolase [Lachnospiraceae bacterium]
MLIIKSFLHDIYNFAKRISKKAYRTCAIIASGAAIIALITMSSREFGGSGKNGINAEKENLSEAFAKSSEGDENGDTKELSLEIVSLESLEKPSVLLSNRENETEEVTTDISEQTKESDYTQVTENEAQTTEADTETLDSYMEAGYQENINEGIIVNNIGLTITEGDYEALKRIVEAEAGNQDDVGRILVANVIFNRVRDSRFPNTVYDVIFQSDGGIHQFQPTADGAYYSVNVSDKTKECVDRALAGEDYSDGALFFTRRTSQDSWFNTSLTFLFVHGAHYFYR